MPTLNNNFDMEGLQQEVKNILGKKSEKPAARIEPRELHIIRLLDLPKIPKQPDPYKLRYDKGYREYKINKGDWEWVPSMTSVIDISDKGKYFEQWAETLGSRREEVLEELARVGELVHYQVTDYLILNCSISERVKSTLTQNPPDFVYDVDIMGNIDLVVEYQGYLEAAALLFDQWLDIYEDKFKLVNVEKAVVNSKYGYAGRFDLQFLLYDNIEKRWVKCIGDIKTSKQLYDSVRTQLTGYNESDDLEGWAERLYELRIHPYPDSEDYGWEFKRLEPDLKGLEESVLQFNERERKELLKETEIEEE